MKLALGAVLLSALLLAAPTACHADARKSSTLRIGTSGDYAPFSVQTASGERSGFDIAVAQRLGQDIQANIRFVPFRWPELGTDLQRRSFDIAMSGVTIRADRILSMAFTRPYAVGGAVVVIRKTEAKRFTKATDFNRAGVRLAVNAGGHLERIARELFPKAIVSPIAENLTLAARLGDLAYDGIVSDSFEAATWPTTDSVIRGPYTRDFKAFAMRRSAPGLRRQVDEWMLAREADGWLDEQRQKFFGEAGRMTQQQLAFEALACAINLRLQLMPYVAAIKTRDGLPIEDPQQEKRVLDRVGAAANSAGLDPSTVHRLFEALIAAAKVIEHAAPPPPLTPTLKLSEVRTLVASISDQILTELTRSADALKDPNQQRKQASAIRDALSLQKLPPEMLTRIADTAAAVRRQ